MAAAGPVMDAVASLASGFGVALRPENLLFALAGCVIGTVVGVLPGIGPIAGMAILLPVTFKLDATGAIIMLAAIYYGAMYGGTITSVLLNVPGEGASAVTAIDGYQMARQGRAGAALAIAAIGSFVGGTLATVALVLAAPPLATVALRFGPPEFFGLMMLGLSLLVGLSGGSVVRGLISALLGLALSIPGTDLVEGTPRLTFGSLELLDGVGFVPVIMGLFGIGEILFNAEGKPPRVFDGEGDLDDADGPGREGLGGPHPARHGDRPLHGAGARHRHHRPDAGLVRRRAEGVAPPGAVRRRRHRGRGGARDGQQRLRQRRPHPALHARRAGARPPSRCCSGRS